MKACFVLILLALLCCQQDAQYSSLTSEVIIEATGLDAQGLLTLTANNLSEQAVVFKLTQDNYLPIYNTYGIEIDDDGAVEYVDDLGTDYYTNLSTDTLNQKGTKAYKSILFMPNQYQVLPRQFLVAVEYEFVGDNSSENGENLNSAKVFFAVEYDEETSDFRTAKVDAGFKPREETSYHFISKALSSFN